MNLKTIGWIVVAVIIIALGVWYFRPSGSVNAPVGGTATTTDNGTTGTANGSTKAPSSPVASSNNTFHSIFTQSGNHECDYDATSATGKSSSKIFIADGKMRGEFRSTMGATPVASLMIYRNGYLYSWSEGATTGTKTSITSLSDLPTVIPKDLAGGAIYGTSADNVGWYCHDWLKDTSAFTIPTYVTFR